MANSKVFRIRILIFLALFVSYEASCRCVSGLLDIIEYNNADIIFIGKIIKINNNRLLTYSFLFEVKKIYKGTGISKTISIKTNKWPVKEDGFYGEIGKTYIIVANKCLFGYCTNQCYPNSESGKDSIYLSDSLFLELISLNKNSRIDSTMNKNITGSGQLKNGFADGLWTYYNYRHYEPYAVGRYKNGLKDSIWNLYSKKVIDSEQIVIYKHLPIYNSKLQRVWMGQQIYYKDKLAAQMYIEDLENKNETKIEIEIFSKKGKINYDDYKMIKGKVTITVIKYNFFGNQKNIKTLELNN